MPISKLNTGSCYLKIDAHKFFSKKETKVCKLENIPSSKTILKGRNITLAVQFV
jgi:hypothetical protein